ncbi:MAG: hypothetical protein AAGI46_02905 [Planctomycetota bacterium]
MTQRTTADHVLPFRRLAVGAMILTLTTASGVAVAQSEGDDKPVQKQSVTPTTHSLHDPSDAILDRLLGEAPATRTTPGSTTRDAETSLVQLTEIDSTKLLREGTFVVNRVGRVRELDDNSFLFVFESDGDTDASAIDPPMQLVANLNLMAVERAVSTSPDRRFRVTGRVTEYRGRNHLILEKVIVLD